MNVLQTRQISNITSNSTHNQPILKNRRVFDQISSISHDVLPAKRARRVVSYKD